MDFTRLTYEAPQFLKLITGVYQVVGSFQESFNAVTWPESYRDTVGYFSAIFSFDIFSAPIFACQTAGDTFPKRFLWHTLSTFCVITLLGAILVHAELNKKHNLRYKRRTTVVWNILLPYLFIVSVSKTTVLMLRCHSIDEGRYLLADYSVRCDVPEYDNYRRLATFFTIVFPIGIPFLFALVLLKNRRNLPPDWWPDNLDEEENKAFIEFRGIKGNEWTERSEWRETVWAPRMAKCHKFEVRFGFLFNAYKHKYFWFESLMSVYKLAQTTLVVFISGADGPGGTTLKILYSMFMATCLIAIVAFLQPYKEDDVLS
eukprot:g7224.t1